MCKKTKTTTNTFQIDYIQNRHIESSDILFGQENPNLIHDSEKFQLKLHFAALLIENVKKGYRNSKKIFKFLSTPQHFNPGLMICFVDKILKTEMLLWNGKLSQVYC